MIAQFMMAVVSGFFAKLPRLLVLALAALFVAGLVSAIASNTQLLFQAVLFGLMLAFLWYLYTLLPTFLRRFISRLFRRSKRDDHGH